MVDESDDQMLGAELPDIFGNAEQSELENMAVCDNYAKGREYARRASDCAHRGGFGDAYMFYSLAERSLKAASRLAIRAAEGNPLVALDNSPTVFRDLMLVQRVRAVAREFAGVKRQPIIELENTRGARMLKLDETLD